MKYTVSNEMDCSDKAVVQNDGIEEQNEQKASNPGKFFSSFL